MVLIPVLDARAKTGPNKRGVCFELEVECGDDQDLSPNGRFNVLGEYGRNLNPFLRSLVPWVLPAKVRVSSSPSGGGKKKISFTIGAKRVAFETLKEKLEDQIQGGDPVLLCEILHFTKPETVCQWPIRCSLLLESLENHGQQKQKLSILHEGELPHFSRDSTFKHMWKILRWFLFPLLSLGLTFAILFNPEPILSRSYSFIEHAPSFKHYVAPLPENLYQAFLLGSLAQIAKNFPPESQQVTSATEEASRILSVSVSLPDLLAMGERLEEASHHQGLTARVFGFFTFVNAMWAFAIIGISVSIGPSIYHILEPLRGLLYRLYMRLIYDLLLPLVRRLHENSVFELCGYCIAWQFLIEGIQQPREYAYLIAFTGVALLAPCVVYSTILHGGLFVRKWDEEFLAQLGSFWFCLLCAPLAIFFQSTFFGYLTVVSMYSGLGFGVVCRSLCWIIGFNSKEALYRCCCSSLLLLLIFVGLRMYSVDEEQICLPFVSPVTVFGSNMYFLGMLILSWLHARVDVPYWARQLHMCISLLVASYIGFVFGFEGLANTSIVYLSIYLVEKYVELHSEMKWSGWILILILSCFLYRSSLYLHQNPQIILSLFSTLEA